MQQERLSIIVSLSALIVVSVAGLGFVWYYTGVLRDTPEAASLSRYPQVLGLTAERGSEGTRVIESSLAGESMSDDVFFPVVQSMEPSQVNDMFLRQCRRSATLQELDEWTGQSSEALRQELATTVGCY
jgi:hypothetical protein